MSGDEWPVDRNGFRYQLEPLLGGTSIPQLRWLRYSVQTAASDCATVRVRGVIAGLESYEPVRTLTVRALADAHARPALATSTLRAELVRALQSPIVLNRKLREVVVASMTRDRLTMSEIAMRCGRIKRDGNGNESGETSWLARRLGILAEAGRGAPTPWIHSDVLALIARSGLGISPREVEL
jgi:hypothetical protein